MSEKRDEVIQLIMQENVSAISIMAERLKITSEEVLELINELLKAGNLNGTLTKDGKRFFKSEIKLSDAPKIERDDTLPTFLSFNSRPAKATSIIGFLILVSGLVVNAFVVDIAVQNFAAILILIGMIIFILGLYGVSRRATPS
jgi:DNA-binding Lrp family transcriptional regulator